MPIRRSLALVALAGCLAVGFICLARAKAATGSPPDEALAKQQLAALEQKWVLERAAPAAERVRFYEAVLADDLVHILADGEIIGKTDQVEFFRTHAAPPGGGVSRIEDLRVRVYRDIGIVNGTVAATGPRGQVLQRARFTDVFEWRDARWQAINLQETAIGRPQH
jgi:hypothetical protein